MNAQRKTSLDELENTIEYKFKNIKLLKNALTHSSYANESKHGEKAMKDLNF